jgi:hypothetical protein
MSEEFTSVDVESTDTGVEAQEVAEPAESSLAETEVETTEEVEQESAKPDFDRNAIAAAARREAESKLRERDAEIKRRFGHLQNPITKKNIETEKDYFDALDAQETLRREEELRSKGIDPSIIDDAIKNNPVVRQAQMVLEHNQQQLLQNDIAEQIKRINALDPSIKTFEDLANSDNQETLLDLVKQGYSLEHAYKVANFDTLMGKKSAAAEQKAINQAKGKSHLTPTTSGANIDDGMEDIPDGQLSKWRAFFPDATDKELREKYNRSKRK